MAPRRIVKPVPLPAIGYDCSREAFLKDRDQEREWDKEMDRCRKMRYKAGYEKLMNIKFGGK